MINRQHSLEIMIDDVTRICEAGGSNAEALAEKYLDKELDALPGNERIAVLDRLISHMEEKNSPGVGTSVDLDTTLISKLFSMLLGERVGEWDLATEETVEKLAGSLNTVFDSLNELIAGINETFMGKTSGTETIRFVIGTQFDQKDEKRSLESYVAQIKEAFSIAHRAFQKAALTKMREILEELDPNNIDRTTEGGLRFGPLRKAELYETYRDKHQTLKNWLDTGLLGEALLREFERACQRFYREKGGEI